MSAGDAGQEALFDLAEVPRLEFGRTATDRPTKVPRYKAEQARRVAMGLHPLTGKPLAGNGKKCQTCAHLRVKQMGGRYYKCLQVPLTSGPATDVRVRWPACTLYEDKDQPEEGE